MTRRSRGSRRRVPAGSVGTLRGGRRQSFAFTSLRTGGSRVALPVPSARSILGNRRLRGWRGLRLLRRSNDLDRRRSHWRSGFDRRKCCRIERPAGLCRESALARGKWRRRCRRPLLRDDCTIAPFRRRSASRGRSALHASLDRCDRSNRRYRGPRRRVVRHFDTRFAGMTRLRECRGGNGDDRAGNTLVHIRDVGRALVVVYVGDRRFIDGRVAGIDVIEVSAAHRIRRPIDIARTERKPAHVAGVAV